MTDLELTKLWLNGYHELAISHGLLRTSFERGLKQMGYQKPEIDKLTKQLADELTVIL